MGPKKGTCLATSCMGVNRDISSRLRIGVSILGPEEMSRG